MPSENRLSDELEVLGLSDTSSYADPKNPSDLLADYLIVSKCLLNVKNDDILVTDLKCADDWKKCERSWRYFQGEGDITARDLEAVSVFDAN